MSQIFPDSPVLGIENRGQ